MRAEPRFQPSQGQGPDGEGGHPVLAALAKAAKLLWWFVGRILAAIWWVAGALWTLLRPIRSWLARRMPWSVEPELKPDRAGADRQVPWIVAPMAYLAVLALAAALALTSLVNRWDTGLEGSLTVEVPGTGDTAAEPIRVEAVRRILDGAPGILSVRVVDRAETAALLTPWLGDDLSFESLPLPTLIAVEIDPQSPPDFLALKLALDEAAPGSTLDDHATWVDELRSVARTIQVIAFLLLGLVGTAAVMTVVTVTRAGFAVHRPTIEILHTLGATDAYVARQFQGQALALGLKGGFSGFALAAATLLILGWVASGPADSTALLPGLAISAGDWLLLLVVPAAIAALALVTARVTVMRALADLP